MNKVAYASVSDLSALEHFLTSLRPPAEGLFRVYRGQTRAYTNGPDHAHLVLPTGARGGYQKAWDPGYERLVFKYVADCGFYKERGDSRNAIIWMPALLQHYGHGSFFLDVSSDLLTALWFSTHKYAEQWIESPINVGKQHTINRRIRIATYSDAVPNETSAVLYVFDVPRWDGRGLVERGLLVDLLKLSEGQYLAALAARLRVQSASLIYAFDPVHDRRNLSDAIRAIVTLEPVFMYSLPPQLKRSTSEVFPPPGEDQLYSALMNIPQRLCVQPLRLEHPLSVQLYRDDGGAETQTNLGPVSICSPVLFHQALLGSSEAAQLTNGGCRGHDITTALPILLETSFLINMPQTDLGGWIESTLPFGIAERMADRSAASVYIELSSLDVCRDWLYGQGVTLRGIWLIREHPHYTIVLCGQVGLQAPKFGVSKFQYDSVRGVFELVSSEPWSSVRAFDAKLALLATLTLLRDLSPGYRPPALYGLGMEGFMQVRSIFEPQLAIATIEKLADVLYIVPRTLDGDLYKGLRFTFDTKKSWDEERIMTDLDGYFDHVREPFYSWYLGEALCSFHLAHSRFDRVIEIANASIAAISGLRSSLNIPGMVTELQCMRAWALFQSGQRRSACQSLAEARQELQKRSADGDIDKDKLARIEQIYASLGCSAVIG